MARSLHHRFSIVVGRIAFEENTVDVLGTLFRYIKPFTLACSTIVGHSSLIHVPHVIQLVAVQDVLVASLSCTRIMV